MASSSQTPPPPAPPDPGVPTIPSQPSDIELAMMLPALVDPKASPPANIIINEADVNTQDPDDLTRHFPALVSGDGQEAWYFIKRRGKRKRSTPSGVWHNEGKSRSIVDSEGQEVVGHRKLFSFRLSKSSPNTGWTMHEFRLPVRGDEESPVVLCKVFRSSRWREPNPHIPATSEAHAQAQAELQVVEDEAPVEPVEAREREGALAARLAAVEALTRRIEANLQERRYRGSDLGPVLSRLSHVALWSAEWTSAVSRWEELSDAYFMAMALSETELRRAELRRAELRVEELRAELRGVELRRAELRRAELRMRELRAEFWGAVLWDAELQREQEAREAEAEAEAEEAEGLARREATRLALWERDLQERERNLTAREAAFQSRYQEVYDDLEEAEVLVLMMATIMMAAAAAALVVRAGLGLAIVGGSKVVVALCSGALEPLF